jgi:hypothetical protein
MANRNQATSKCLRILVPKHNAASGFQEVDRLLARVAIEHQIEIENPVLEREGDDGE